MQSSPKAEKELSGAEANTTNNRMEMLAVISALELLKEPCRVTVITDSSYVCDAFRKDWISGWIKRDWKTAAKKPVKNQDLWLRMLAGNRYRIRSPGSGSAAMTVTLRTSVAMH